MKKLICTAIVALACAFAASSGSASIPVLWSISLGGNGNYYEYFDFSGTDNTWQGALTEAQTHSFTIDGFTYTGHLAPISSADEQTFLETTFIQPRVGDWAIVWSGDYANNGVLYGTNDTVITDTSWINWVNPYGSNNSPDVTISLPDNWGVTISGSGYDYSWDVLPPSFNSIGGYVVEYGVGTSLGSGSAVPEPSTYSLFAIGTLALYMAYFRKRVR